MVDDWGGAKKGNGDGQVGLADPWDLWPEAGAHLTAVGLALEPDAEVEFRGILEQAGKELELTVSQEASTEVGFEAALLTRRNEAVNNLREIIGTLAEEASARGERAVSLETLRTVLKRLCPVWPFCK